MLELVVFSLLTWRLSSLLAKEDGPFELFARLRDRVGVRFDDYSHCIGKNVVAQGLCCVWCSSVWVGWFIALLVEWRTAVYMGLVYSAGAIVVDRVVRP